MDKRKSKDKSDSKKGKPSKKVVDLTVYRAEKTEEKRREYERVLFHRVLGVYSFVEKQNLAHVEVLDISYSGILFRELHPDPAFAAGAKVAMRFYFTPSSYLRLVVDVKRVRPFTSGGREGLEYGCELDKSTKSYEVLRQLVNFMYKYADVACQDPTPPNIWF
jgi:hypothetical protein